MKRHLPLLLLGLPLVATAQPQRYLEEVFTDAQVVITSDVPFGTNIDFLTSNFASPNVPTEVGQLQTLVSTQQPIPGPFFDPTDGSTAVKVKTLRMDIYEPDQGVDPVTARPVMLYIHTGNVLPPGYPGNGSPVGTRSDSCAVEICKRMARRGYVAVSMSYRLGWNPLAPTEEERRGQLLNGIYRAIHDVRQCVRTLKADAAGGNSWGIDPNKIITLGEGTGGYIALAHTTLNKPSELFVEKFDPNGPFPPDSSYVDTNKVGNLAGFNGMLTLYRPNGFNHQTQFCVNLGGALADTTWLEAGDPPMVSFHPGFDPSAPFTYGIVIVPTTGGPVVDVPGSNMFIPWANNLGNNASFATLPDGDPYTDRARSLYGQTLDGVTITSNGEGLFPVVRPRWPAPATDEAGPWQWWDPNSPDAQDIIPGLNITTHQASLASNPDMSGVKGRAYIDTIMGYMNPRIVCALQLGPCSLVGMEENPSLQESVGVYPNPASDRVTFTSTGAPILGYEVFDMDGRRVRSAAASGRTAMMERQGLQPGAYLVRLRFADGMVTRKLMLD